MKRNVLYTALMLGLATGAQAGVNFTVGGATYDVGAFDWAQTSFLAKGGNTAIYNYIVSGGICPAGSCDFTVLSHARLRGTDDQSGNPNNMTGLNTSYEITMVASFTETVTGVLGGNMATFATNTAGPALIEWYYDTAVNSNSLQGFGFDDGDLILRGTQVGPAVGTYTVLPQVTQMDQFPGGLPNPAVDNYPGQQTLVGVGNQTNINVGGLTWDPAFFTGLVSLTLNYINISQNLPFTTVNPSDCFTLSTDGVAVVGNGGNVTAGCASNHINGPYAAQIDPNGPRGYVPVTGPINSAPVVPDQLFAPDFVAQTDFSSPVSGVTIPEPGSLALLGLGLGALGLSLRRRKMA